MSKANKFEAVFKGGDYDGKTTWLDQAYPELSQVVEWKDQSGKVLRTETSKYKLISNGLPLQYEISN